MVRVADSSIAPRTEPASARLPAVPAVSADLATASGAEDEVALTAAGLIALTARPARLPELKATVASKNYQPDSAETSRKIVDDALRRD